MKTEILNRLNYETFYYCAWWEKNGIINMRMELINILFGIFIIWTIVIVVYMVLFISLKSIKLIFVSLQKSIKLILWQIKKLNQKNRG